ncbi:MAG: UDP-N-acetylmuramate--L-alanine ligase [Bdellovibrionia bacterium]
MGAQLSSLNLSSLKHVHIIGVCGTLMGSFAAYLKRQKIRVTGSDQNIYPPMSDVLKQAGVELLGGYQKENLSFLGQKPDLVVIGNVIRADNPEARAAIDENYVYGSLPEVMENLLLQNTRNLVVAGTHGKTTTSSLLAHILVQAGLSPSYFIGGVSQDLPNSFHVSDVHRSSSASTAHSLFVLEGDEYDTAFWDKVPKFNHYCPDDVILTSVEYDHADIYPDFQAVYRAFEGLVRRIRPQGRLIACVDWESVSQLIRSASVPVITYGSRPQANAQFTPAQVRFEQGLSFFEILEGQKKVAEIELQIPGMHNVLNALSAWIEARQLGVNESVIAHALKTFRGVKRRQEIRGEVGGVLVIDDFAHHPTAVRETLRALRAKYPSRRLIPIFEPRSATSRRKIFQKEYAQAFEEADLIFIASPFDQSRIVREEQFSSDALAQDLIQMGRKAWVFQEVDDGVQSVLQQVRKNDVIAVLSNGGFGGFIPKLLKALEATS